MHRLDGTPLDFSSRTQKAEGLRQHAIEQIYNAEKASWGLLSAPPVTAAGQPPLGRGRGKHIVRPAWLVRQERGTAP